MKVKYKSAQYSTPGKKIGRKLLGVQNFSVTPFLGGSGIFFTKYGFFYKKLKLVSQTTSFILL